MNRRQDPGSGHRVAMVTLLMGALWTWPAAAQTARDTAQSAAEQRRAEERDLRLREQAIPERKARPDAHKAKPALTLPLNESPCFVIEQIELRGDSAGHFGWVLDALTTPDGLDAPLRRCLGAAGTGVLVQRAQHAVVARGFVTTRVMVEPQDLTQGILALCARLAAIPLGRKQLPRCEASNGRSACGLRSQGGGIAGRTASGLIISACSMPPRSLLQTLSTGSNESSISHYPHAGHK